MHQRVEKSRSEPAIPPSADQPKPAEKQHSSHVTNNSDARKLSAQSYTSPGTSERKPRRSSRTKQVASLNEVRPINAGQRSLIQCTCRLDWIHSSLPDLCHSRPQSPCFVWSAVETIGDAIF